MTIHTYRVRRLRIYEETTFGVDLTASLASFIALNHTAATVTIDNPRVQPGTMQQLMDSTPYDVLTGYKRATATITCNLTGQTARSTSSSTHTQTAQGMLFRSYFGGQRLGQGDTCAAGSSTNIINVTTEGRWETGAGIAYPLDDGLRLRARHITSKSTAAMTVYPDLDADLPSNPEIAYSSADYYFGGSASDSSNNTTVQMAVEGAHPDDRFLLMGGKVTGCTFTTSRGSIATVQFTVQFVDWIYADNAATPFDDTVPLTYVAETSNGDPLPVHDSDLMWVYNGTTTALGASEITVGCSAAWVPVPSTAGINGVLGWARNHAPAPISASITIPFEGLDWHSNRDAEGTAGSLHFQVGSTLTHGACLFYLSALQVRDVQVIDADGLTATRISLIGGKPITVDTTHLAHAQFVVHMF